MKKTSLILLILLSAVYIKNAFPEDNNNYIHEIHYYAKNYFQQGKYREAIRAYNKILAFDPEHAESKKMVDICRQKIGETEELLKEAQDLYKKGNMYDALAVAENAFSINRKDFEIKEFLLRILTELGMESSIVGKHQEGLTYLQRALDIDPENSSIKSLVKDLTELIASQDGSPADSSSASDKRLAVLFESYRLNQEKLMKEYMETKKQLDELIKKTEAAQKSKPGFDIRLIYALISAVLVIAVTVILYAKKKASADVKPVKIELKHAHLNTADQYSKAMKQLEMIEEELKNAGNNKIVRSMLEKRIDEGAFFASNKADIFLKALSILYRLNPSRSVTEFEKLIKSAPEHDIISSGELHNNSGADLVYDLLDRNTDPSTREVLMKVVSKIKSSKKVDKDISDKLGSLS